VPRTEGSYLAEASRLEFQAVQCAKQGDKKRADILRADVAELRERARMAPKG